MVESLKVADDGSLFVTVNCSFDGIRWQRTDTTKTAELLMVDINGKLKRFRASAGDNPITSWDLLNGVVISDTSGSLPDITKITTRNHNDLQNLNAAGHTIGAFPSSELNQPSKLLKLNTNFAEVNTDQIPPYLRKLADIPQFQIWMKNRLGHLPDVTITGAAGEEYCYSLTFDGTYIWAGLNTSPFKILKINPVNNSYTVITGASGENGCLSLTFDGIYIWAGLYTSPFKILKINPVNNSYTVITGASGENVCLSLTFDGTYIWAGLATVPFKILKINPVNNSYTVITGAAGESVCLSLTFDGIYIWAGLYSSPVKILKINPVNNSYTVITGASGENYCEALTFDGTYIWAGLYVSPVKIIKKFAYLRKLEI